MHPPGLHIFRIDARVADERPGHAHHLAGVGRICQHFLVAGHGGIKNDFPCSQGPVKERPSKIKPSSKAKYAFMLCPFSL